jgi:CPW-WPC domain-containing protein
VRVGDPSGKAAGENVGASILAADQELAAQARQNGGTSDFPMPYVQTLTANERVLVNPEVSQVISKINGLAGNLIEKDDLCERRWDAKCPDGWTLAGQDQCIAPAAYGGACKTVSSFSGMTLAEKQQIAEECKAPWPCIDGCADGHDYSELCPEGWSDEGAGFCKAPVDFQTDCATSYNFGTMDLKTKGELDLWLNLEMSGYLRLRFQQSMPGGLERNASQPWHLCGPSIICRSV